MTAKEKLIRDIRLMSSGTIAGIIGTTKYILIDQAASKALLYVSEKMTEQECAAIHTMEDICSVFLKAQESIG